MLLFSLLLIFFSFASSTTIELSSTSATYYFTLNSSNPQESQAIFITSQSSFTNNTFQYSSSPFSFSNFVKAVDIVPVFLNITVIFPNTWTYQDASNNLQDTSSCSNQTFYDCFTNPLSYEICSILAPIPPQYGLSRFTAKKINCSSQAISPCNELSLSDYEIKDSQGNSFFISAEQLCPETDIIFTFTVSVYQASISAMSNLVGPGDLTFHYLSLEPAFSDSWGTAVSTLRIERPSDIISGVSLEGYNQGDFSYLARNDIESVVQTKLIRHDYGSDVYCQYEVSYTGMIRGIYINDYPSSNHMPRQYDFDLQSTAKSSLSFLLRANQVNLINIVGYRLTNTTLKFVHCRDKLNNGNSVPFVQFSDYKFGEVLLDPLSFSMSANQLAGCPGSCPQCTFSGVCVKCAPGKFLVYGTCVQLCPGPFSIPDYKQVCNSILESSSVLLAPPQIINQEEVILDYYDDFGFKNKRAIVLHTTNQVGLGAAPYVWPANSSAPLLAESVVIFLPSSRSLGFNSITIPFKSIANSSLLSSSSQATGLDYPWNNHLSSLLDKVFAVIYPLNYHENYLVGTYWNQEDNPEELTTAQQKSPSSSSLLKNRRYQYLTPTGFYIFQAFVECLEECQVEVSCDGQVQLYKNEQISLFNVDFKSSRWTYKHTQNLTGAFHLKFIVKNAKFFQPFISGNNFSLYSPANPASIFSIGPFPVDQISSCFIPNCQICQDNLCLSCQQGFFLSSNQTECLAQCPLTEFYSTAESVCEASCAASQLFNETDNECIPDCDEPGYYYTADLGCQVCVEDCLVCHNSTTCLQCKIDNPSNTETFCFRKLGTLFNLKDFNVEQTVSIKRDSSDMELALVIADKSSFGNFSFFFESEGRGIPRVLKVLKMQENNTFSTATIPALSISEPGYLTTHYLKIQRDDSGTNFSSTGFLGVYYKDFPLYEDVPQIDSAVGPLVYNYSLDDDQGLYNPDSYYKTMITSRIYEHNLSEEIMCSLRITFYGDLRGVYINGELVFAHSTSNSAYVMKTTRQFKLHPNEMAMVSFIGYRIQFQQVNFTSCTRAADNLPVVPEFTSYLLTGSSTDPNDFFVFNNTFCGDNCATCLDSLNCIQCEDTFYLQNGLCVPYCPSSQMQLVYGFCGAEERSQGYLDSKAYSSANSSLTVSFHMPLGMDLQLLVRVHPFVVSSTSIGTYVAQGNNPSLSQGAYQLKSFAKNQKDFGVNIHVESIVAGVTGPVDLIISTVRNDSVLFSDSVGNLAYVPIGTDFDSLDDDQIYYWDFFMSCLSGPCQLQIQGQGTIEILLNERTFVFTGYLDSFIGNITLNRNFATATGLQHFIIKASNATKFSFELTGSYLIYSQGDLVNHNTVPSVQYQLFNASSCYNGYKTKCYSCKDGYFLDPANGYCAVTCPSGTLPFLPERLCISNSSSSGLVKRGSYYIFNCTENPGYYYTIDQGCVSQCNNTCLTCSGPLSSQCLACPYPRLFQSNNSTCLCPVGTQEDPISGGCQSLSYVNLTGNSSGIYCGNLTLKAEIRADELQAYNVTFHWELASQGTSASLISQAQIQAFLHGEFTQNVEIPGVFLESNQAYNLTVSYINAANKTIQDWKIVNISYSTVPNFTLSGANIGIKNNVDHQFYAEFLDNMTCNLNSIAPSAFNYTWTIIESNSVVYSNVQNPLVMILPSCTLVPQSSYTLNLKISLKNTSIFTEQNLTLTTSPEIFTASILTSPQVYLADADLTLEGNIIYNESCSVHAPGQVYYTWFCENQTQPCAGSFGIPRTSQQLTVPKYTFQQGETPVFTLQISKNGNTQNSSSLQISINDPTALFLHVACEDIACFQYATNNDYLIYGTVQTVSGLNLSSSELSKLNVTWTVFPQIPIAYFLSTLKLFSNSLDLSSVNFVTVTFIVQNLTRTFTSSLSLPIDHPPVFGNLQASPSSGISLATNFLISTDSWSDPDVPLTYQFYYSFPSDTVLTPLRSGYTADAQITTILPGQFSSGSVVNIWVSVKDSSGAESIASAQVQVSPQIQSLQQAINYYSQLLFTAQNQDGPFEITQIIAMITKELTQWENILTENAPNPVCPTCSGHGSCPTNIARCDCEAGWAIIDCFVRVSDVDLISNLKQNLLEEIEGSYKEMLLNNSASAEEMETIRNMIHQILVESVGDQHFNTNQTLLLVQNILNDTLKDSNALNPDEIQAVSEILSDMMEFSATYDCKGLTLFTKNLEQKAEEYLQTIAESSLSDKIANQNATVITTENLEMYFQKLSICSLDNKVVTTSSTSPQVTISVNAGVNLQDCSSQVNLEYYAFNDNLLNCSAEVNGNRTLTILGINITNTTTGDRMDSTSVSVTIDFGQNPAKNCPASCKLLSEKVCYCEDLSPFDVGNQLAKVFRNSNLSYLKNVSSILTFQFWKTGSFWMIFALTVWFFVTLGLIRFKLLTYNVMNKIRQCNKINVISSLLKVAHPLAAIYLIPKYERLSKSARALVFYTRNLLLLSFTSLFSGPSRSEAAYDYHEAFRISFNFNIYLLLLPYFTIHPLLIVVKFLMKDLQLQKCQFSKTFKGKLAYFMLRHVRLWLVLLVIFVNFIMILIVNANQTSVQRIAWTINFVESLLQDLILTPFLYLIFQYCLFRVYCNQDFAKKFPYIHKMLPKVFDEYIQEIFAKLNDAVPEKINAKRIKISPISSDNKTPDLKRSSIDNDTVISGLGISDNSLNLDGLLAKSPLSSNSKSINLLNAKAIKEETIEESPCLPRLDKKYSSISVSRRNSGESLDFDLISRRSHMQKGSRKFLMDLQDDSPDGTPRLISKKAFSKPLRFPSSIEAFSPKIESSFNELNPLFNLSQSIIPQRKDSTDSQVKMINSKDLESPTNEAKASFRAKRNSSGGSQYQTFTENSNVFVMDEVKPFSGKNHNIHTPKRVSLLREETLGFRPDSPGSLEATDQKRLSQEFKSEILTSKMRMAEVLKRAQKIQHRKSSLFQNFGKTSGVISPTSSEGVGQLVSDQEADQITILNIENE